ncbi:MAG: chromate transporter, partial [Pseudanabaena sp.]
MYKRQGLAIIYVEYQKLPAVGWLLYGVKPVIIAIIAQSLWKLGKSALKNIPTWIAGLVVLAMYFLQINEVTLMLGAGVVVSLVRNLISSKNSKSLSIFFFPFSSVPLPLGAITTNITPTITPKPWHTVFFSFLKIGSVLYG